MDVEGRGSSSMFESCEEDVDLRRGPWTVEEDISLINYIADHGDGRWNSLARCAGLKRTGKSCRLRWLNYLRPDVRRGNITLQEQLLILELHSCWGNKWSKIAQHLPGRTDNEIKNYWRTRVQKHAKQLKCDVNSKQFKDTMRCLWMPRLVERIQSAASTSSSAASAAPLIGRSGDFAAVPLAPSFNLDFHEGHHMLLPPMVHQQSYTPENSSTGASSDSFGTHVSTDSDMTDYYYVPVDNNHFPDDFGASQLTGVYPESSFTSPPMTGSNPDQGGVSFQAMDHQQENGQWVMDGVDSMADDFWNVDDVWFLQQQHQQQ